MVQPIWKNYFVNLGSEESVEYVISYDSGDGLTAVYSGKAWKRPGEQFVSICINNICEDWLNNTFPSLSESFQRQNVLVEFVVQKISMAHRSVFDLGRTIPADRLHTGRKIVAGLSPCHTDHDIVHIKTSVLIIYPLGVCCQQGGILKFKRSRRCL